MGTDHKILLALLFAIIFIPFAGYADSYVSVNMSKGWNFVTAPYYDYSIDYSECGIKAIYHFSAVNNSYIKTGSLDYMEPGLGYWVYTNTSCSLDFFGSEEILLTDLGDSYDGSLKKAWNHLSGTTTQLNIYDNSGYCDIKAVYSYDAFSRQYSKVQIIEPGKSYWVYSSNDCKLSMSTAEKNNETTVLLVSSAGSLTASESEFFKGLKTQYSTVDTISYSDATATKLGSYKNIYVTGYSTALDANALSQTYDSGNNIYLLGSASQYTSKMSITGDSVSVSGSSLYVNDNKGSVAALSSATNYYSYSSQQSSLSSSYGNQVALNEEKKYQAEKESKKTESYEIPSQTLLSSVGSDVTNFAVKELIRDAKGNLYLIFTFYLYKNAAGQLWEFDHSEIRSYTAVSRYDGVGVAISKDNGKTWTYLGTNEFPDDPIAPSTRYDTSPKRGSKELCNYAVNKGSEGETSYSGSGIDNNAGIYLFYTSKRYEGEGVANPLLMLQEGSGSCDFPDYPKIYQSQRRVMHVTENGIIDSVLDVAFKIGFFMSYNYTQYFREYVDQSNAKLYYSRDGITLVPIGYLNTAPDENGKTASAGKLFEDNKGQLFGLNGNNIYIKRGDYFLFLRNQSLSLTAKTILFDSNNNLYITGSKELSNPRRYALYYYFIPSSKLEGNQQIYESVKITTGSKCASCTQLKTFLQTSNVQFNEDNSDVTEPIITIKKSGTEYSLTGFDKLKLARHLGIELGPELLDSNASYVISYLNSNNYPYILSTAHTSSGSRDTLRYHINVSKYFYSTEWSKEGLFTINDLASYSVIPSQEAEPDEKNITIIVKKPDIAQPVNLRYPGGYDYEAKYVTKSVINNYNLYTTVSIETNDLTATAVASQLIPGTVFYIPLDDATVSGKIQGPLASYVTEESAVEEGGQKYYKVKVDLRNKLKASNSRITPETIKGFVELSSGLAEMTLNVIDSPLATNDYIMYTDAHDMSIEAGKTEDGRWIVVNNLPIPNSISCRASSIQLSANSYRVFSKEESKSYGLDSCLVAVQANTFSVPDCNSWSDALNELKIETITAYDTSLPLYKYETDKTNYEQFFGTASAKTYRIADISTYKPEDYTAACISEVEDKSVALLEFNGDIIGGDEDYSPATSIVLTG